MTSAFDINEFQESRRRRAKELLELYIAALDACKREEDIHQFLASNPEICEEAFNEGSVPMAVVSKFPLGSEYITDLIVLGCRSFGFPLHCIFVELESPNTPPFTKAGKPGAALTQATKQVIDWQHWLSEHMDEFTLSFPKAIGSGQEGMEKNLRSSFWSFKIVIGRRHHMSRSNDEYRASLFRLHGGKLEVMTYDRIADKLKYNAGIK